MGFYGVTPLVNNKLYADLDLNGYNINGSGEITASGALVGGVKLLSKTADTNTLVAAECYGHFITYSGANNTTFNLPPVVAGMYLTIRAAVAKVITINPDNVDRIILDQTALADGVAILSPGAIANTVTLIGDSANGWTVISRAGTWVSE
jgi:hypothetical protein